MKFYVKASCCGIESNGIDDGEPSISMKINVKRDVAGSCCYCWNIFTFLSKTMEYIEQRK